MRWVIDYIVEQVQAPEWVSTSPTSRVKASLSFNGMFWWAMVKLQILPTHNENTLTTDYVVLVTSILASYDIDQARLIVEQIHETTLMRSTSIHFSFLIQHLCIATVVENPLALQRASHQLVHMLERLIIAPPSEPPSSSTTTTPTSKRPPQTVANKKGAHYYY